MRILFISIMLAACTQPVSKTRAERSLARMEQRCNETNQIVACIGVSDGIKPFELHCVCVKEER